MIRKDGWISVSNWVPIHGKNILLALRGDDRWDVFYYIIGTYDVIENAFDLELGNDIANKGLTVEYWREIPEIDIEN